MMPSSRPRSHARTHSERYNRDTPTLPPILPRRESNTPVTLPPVNQINMPAFGYHPPPPGPVFDRSQAPAPPQGPITHKVWILNCKNCGTFLTNRAMRAVLLLRPEVPLYSSDAMPVNCGPYSPNRANSSRSSRAGSSSDSRMNASPMDVDNSERSCECLTQTLSCHQCGCCVGYMLVIACMRCSSSALSPSSPGYPLFARQRATNGHRFVFHSSEVLGEERCYISGEQGIVREPHIHIPPPPQQIPDHVRTFLPPYAARALTVLSVPNQAPPPPPAPTTAKVPKLRTGDVVYWHHLTFIGDLPVIIDDDRARASRSAGSGRHYNYGEENNMYLPGMPGAIWCAR